LLTPWPVLNRSQRSTVKPIAFDHASHRATFQTPTVKLKE